MSQKQFKQKSIRPLSVNELQPSPELLEVQSFLPISAEDRERLKKDIEKSGEIRDPIKIYFDKEGNPMILGGFNRWHIAQELGWQFVPCEVMEVAPKERRELAIMDNLARRHMTREQKQRIVEMFLRNDPAQSNVMVARKTGVDDKTVGKVRQQLEATSEIPRLDKRKGADGKERKASIEKSVKPEKALTSENPRLDKTVSVDRSRVKKHHVVFNTILDAVDELEAFDLQKLAVMSAEETLKRLKGTDRKKAVTDLQKVIKKFQ